MGYRNKQNPLPDLLVLTEEKENCAKQNPLRSQLGMGHDSNSKNEYGSNDEVGSK
jgi:hypothetical protein